MKTTNLGYLNDVEAAARCAARRVARCGRLELAGLGASLRSAKTLSGRAAESMAAAGMLELRNPAIQLPS